jgi:hypothetical protein
LDAVTTAKRAITVILRPMGAVGPSEKIRKGLTTACGCAHASRAAVMFDSLNQNLKLVPIPIASVSHRTLPTKRPAAGSSRRI